MTDLAEMSRGQGMTANFSRTVAHVEHRARAYSVPRFKPTPWPACSTDYRTADAYRQAIADEPAQLAGRRFTEILQTRPPQSFIDLWQADLRAWRDATSR